MCIRPFLLHSPLLSCFLLINYKNVVAVVVLFFNFLLLFCFYFDKFSLLPIQWQASITELEMLTLILFRTLITFSSIFWLPMSSGIPAISKVSLLDTVLNCSHLTQVTKSYFWDHMCSCVNASFQLGDLRLSHLSN